MAPSPTRHSRDAHTPRIGHYREWAARRHGLHFADYDALWRWSTHDVGAFWQSIWDYFELQSPTQHTGVLPDNVMPGARWFPGARLNYARQVFRHVQAAHAAGQPALVSGNERGELRELSWPELQRRVASLALHLRSVGLESGDRVAAYLPNNAEAVVAFLAVVSLGGIWSICAPDMGTPSVLDRFRQIRPKVLIACDGVRYGGRDIDRSATVQELRAGLPTVAHVIVQRSHAPGAQPLADCADCADMAQCMARDDAQTAAFEPEWLPFDHPLWIVYSSGTTGMPKPIVHGHGGIVIVQLALLGLHNDLGSSYAAQSLGERFHWYSSTGWVMWNAQVGGLLLGTTCCIFDGSPGGRKDAPDWGVLWRFAAQTRTTFFGAGAAFYAGCMKSGIDLAQCGDLGPIRTLGSTGSPLGADAQAWGTDQFRALRPDDDDIFWCNMSGGTDFAGAFIGANRELPLVAGVMQCRLLGFAVEAWNERGESVVGEVGELVCTQPAPSMPLCFWDDAGDQRYLASYFDMYPEGVGRPSGRGYVWRHGDWIRISADGGCVIYGRSDATINRHGLRMGSSEIYSAVEALPEVIDSIVVDLEYLGLESYMPLFVVMRPGATLDGAMKDRINGAVRAALSPRFVPDAIFEVPGVPRTLSGKKQELPLKKLLLGQPVEKVFNTDAMANPECLAWCVEFAHRRQEPPAAQAATARDRTTGGATT